MTHHYCHLVVSFDDRGIASIDGHKHHCHIMTALLVAVIAALIAFIMAVAPAVLPANNNKIKRGTFLAFIKINILSACFWAPRAP